MITEVTPHNFTGLFTFSLALLVYATGFMGGFLGKFSIGTKRWAHHADPHVRIWAAHAILARVNVIGGYLACSFGIYMYQLNYGNEDTQLSVGNMILFTLWTIFVEVVYRVWIWRSKNEQVLLPNKPEWTMEKLKESVYDKK